MATPPSHSQSVLPNSQILLLDRIDRNEDGFTLEVRSRCGSRYQRGGKNDADYGGQFRDVCGPGKSNGGGHLPEPGTYVPGHRSAHGWLSALAIQFHVDILAFFRTQDTGNLIRPRVAIESLGLVKLRPTRLVGPARPIKQVVCIDLSGKLAVLRHGAFRAAIFFESLGVEA